MAFWLFQNKSAWTRHFGFFPLSFFLQFFLTITCSHKLGPTEGHKHSANICEQALRQSGKVLIFHPTWTTSSHSLLSFLVWVFINSNNNKANKSDHAYEFFHDHEDNTGSFITILGFEAFFPNKH